MLSTFNIYFDKTLYFILSKKGDTKVLSEVVAVSNKSEGATKSDWVVPFGC